MKKHNSYNSRNFGYGKQLPYAAKEALKDRYGDGKFATRASHVARFSQFAMWCKEEGIKDARFITREHITKYATILSERVNNSTLSVSYAQNQLSSINVVLSMMRKDNIMAVSPAENVGNRSHVRLSEPLSLSRARYESALSKLSSNEAKIALELSREFGLRLREVALFRPHDAISEVLRTGKLNITRGAKGGRTADRMIKPSSSQLRLLSRAQQLLGKRSLVDQVGKYTEWKNKFYEEYSRSGAHLLIGKFHDNRAAFACEKYKELTRHDAPVVIGKRTAPKALDRAARVEISKMLGHGRIEVVAAYIGTSK